jgi:hypothetical protein
MNRCATYQEMPFIKGEVLISRGTGLNWNFLEKNLKTKEKLDSDPDSVSMLVFLLIEVCCGVNVFIADCIFLLVL